MSARGFGATRPDFDRDHMIGVLRDHLGKADAYISAVEELIEQAVLDGDDDDDDDDTGDVTRRRNHVAHLIESTKLAVRAAISLGDELDRVLKTATASYVSPEQLNEQRVDGRSDLFAVGAVLWELLVGEPLFEYMSPAEVAARMTFHTPPHQGSVRPGTAHELEDVVARLLSREPGARYRTATEASADLARCAATHKGARDLARLIEERIRPEGDREHGHRGASSRNTIPMPPMPLVRGRVLLDLHRREPSTFSDAEYHALLEPYSARR